MEKRMGAEFLGTFWLVFGGCGSAILAARFLDAQNSNVNYGIGLVGVALAFGLTVLTMAYASRFTFRLRPLRGRPVGRAFRTSWPPPIFAHGRSQP
jgi:hypothetical protein